MGRMSLFFLPEGRNEWSPYRLMRSTIYVLVMMVIVLTIASSYGSLDLRSEVSHAKDTTMATTILDTKSTHSIATKV